MKSNSIINWIVKIYNAYISQLTKQHLIERFQINSDYENIMIQEIKGCIKLITMLEFGNIFEKIILKLFVEALKQLYLKKIC